MLLRRIKRWIVTRTQKGKSKDRRCIRITTKRKWKNKHQEDNDTKVEKKYMGQKTKRWEDRRMISRYRKGIMNWKEKKQPRTE